MTMKITFLGATGTVTGSKYLVEAFGKKIMVDCGLFQGHKALRLRNWAPLPIDPATVDAVVITHAHIDHTGYLPLFVKEGFKGPIYATEATYDLCSILLRDSAHLQEEDAKRANQYGYSKHKPALPLYTTEDALLALEQFRIVGYAKPYHIFKEVCLSWYRAGHILGASFIQLHAGGESLLFTGDMGRQEDPIMNPPVMMQSTDYLVVESTYGDRLHDTAPPEEHLARVVNDTFKRGGTVLIPAFAVGRAQMVMYYLYHLKEAKKIPNIPIYLDSPMAINATSLLCKHPQEHKLSLHLSHLVCNAATYVNTPEESKFIGRQTEPKIIISASGMLTGGRVLHHLKAFGPHEENTILLTGFQAGGTRGDRLLKGEREIKIHGKMVPINAQVDYLTNLSAHADYSEILMWLKGFTHPPRKTFITHGEPEAAASLKQKIEAELGWVCVVPDYLDEEVLR